MKVKYIIDYKRYIYIECKTAQEVKIVEELNKNMEAFIKSEQRYKERTISIDHIMSKDGKNMEVELVDEAPIQLSKLINEEKLKMIKEGINLLTPRQKEIFLGVVIGGRSYQEVGSILSISKTTVSESYKSAVKKIRKNIKKFN